MGSSGSVSIGSAFNPNIDQSSADDNSWHQTNDLSSGDNQVFGSQFTLSNATVGTVQVADMGLTTAAKDIALSGIQAAESLGLATAEASKLAFSKAAGIVETKAEGDTANYLKIIGWVAVGIVALIFVIPNLIKKGN